jgi:hypothetical protein
MATPANSVQARDRASVLMFYENQDIPAFSIRQKGQLLYNWNGDNIAEGMQQLAAFIDTFIVKPRSGANYTLCVHDDLKQGQKINNTTPFNGSINFMLFDPYSQAVAGDGGQGMPGGALANFMEEVRGELRNIRQEVQQREEEGDDDDRDGYAKLGVIGDILRTPIGEKIGWHIVEHFLPESRKPQGQIAGVGGQQESEEQQIVKLQKALEVLIDADPDVPEYLHKLAVMYQTDAKKFKNIMGTVRMFLG